MNRAQRRHPGKARRAALALLVAGTLAAGASIAHADTSYMLDELIILGGGGGAGGGNSSAGAAGGGGGYIRIADDGLFSYIFGGGGNAIFVGLGGSIGGGSIAGSTLAGGRSAFFAPASGDPVTGVPDATSILGIPASSVSLLPEPGLIDAERGGDGDDNTFSGGSGGSAYLIVPDMGLSVYKFLLASGEAGEAQGFADGGAGGDASFAVDMFQAKTIEINQQYPDYVRPAGAVSFATRVLISGLDYNLNVMGSPDISIDGYKFDMTGVASGDTLLAVSGYSLDPTLAVEIFNTPETLKVGDSVILINGINETPVDPRTVVDEEYTFEVTAQYPDLIATVTAIKEEPPVTPEPEKPGVPPTGDGLLVAVVAPLVMLVGAGSLVTVAKRALKRRSNEA